MWRELTALWSMGTLLMTPLTQGISSHPAVPMPKQTSVSAPAAPPQMAVTPHMKDQFSECLREVAQQIKVQFADEIIARHPIFGTPIRVSDSRVTVEKIAEKLRQKTESYVENGGGFEIDLTWNKQQSKWLIRGYLVLEKDALTGSLHRQYAKNLIELKKLLCG